jgi:hypothetical protein
MTTQRAILMALAFTTVAAPVGGQHLVVSGAVQRDTQRFPDSEVPTRLSGSAMGWTVGADAVLKRHVAVSVEWSDAGTIEDVRSTTLDINGRATVITSTLRHHTKTFAALGGYSHMLSSRVQVAYLVGAAFTNVRREFESDAPGLVLVGPSDPVVSGRASLVDRLQEVTGGADVFVRITPKFRLVAGVRAQGIRLPLDVSGWSVVTSVGAGWAP